MSRRLDILAIQEFGGQNGKVLVHLGYRNAASDGRHEGRYAIEVPYDELVEADLEALRTKWQQTADLVDTLNASYEPKVVTLGPVAVQ